LKDGDKLIACQKKKKGVANVDNNEEHPPPHRLREGVGKEGPLTKKKEYLITEGKVSGVKPGTGQGKRRRGISRITFKIKAEKRKKLKKRAKKEPFLPQGLTVPSPTKTGDDLPGAAH